MADRAVHHLGSPLGLTPVRSRFKRWTGQGKLQVPVCVARWINAANRGDVVCTDPDLGDDVAADAKFSNAVVDSPNPELKDDRHSATGYLRLANVHAAVRNAVGAERPVSPFLPMRWNRRIGSFIQRSCSG